MLRLTRPSHAELERALNAAKAQQPAYPCVGGTLRGEAPDGYRLDRYQVELGQGDEVWSNAVLALKDWQPQRGSGLTVLADAPIAAGTTVVIAAPLPVGFAVATCRVVGLIDDPDCWGFAYGTLPTHPEEGEELFAVRRREGLVTFEIVAFSKPRHPLVRLAGPVTRALQTRATQRYLTAMQHPGIT